MLADREIKQEAQAAQDMAQAQELPRLVRKQRDPAEQARVDAAWAELEQARLRVSARFAGYREEERDALADELIKETRAEIFEERHRFAKKQLDPAERARREQVVAEMEKLREQVSARFADYSEEERDALADGIVREAVDSLFEKGRIRYESDPQS